MKITSPALLLVSSVASALPIDFNPNLSSMTWTLLYGVVTCVMTCVLHLHCFRFKTHSCKRNALNLLRLLHVVYVLSTRPANMLGSVIRVCVLQMLLQKSESAPHACALSFVAAMSTESVLVGLCVWVRLVVSLQMRGHTLLTSSALITLLYAACNGACGCSYCLPCRVFEPGVIFVTWSCMACTLLRHVPFWLRELHVSVHQTLSSVLAEIVEPALQKVLMTVLRTACSAIETQVQTQTQTQTPRIEHTPLLLYCLTCLVCVSPAVADVAKTSACFIVLHWACATCFRPIFFMRWIRCIVYVSMCTTCITSCIAFAFSASTV